MRGYLSGVGSGKALENILASEGVSFKGSDCLDITHFLLHYRYVRYSVVLISTS